MSDMYKTLEEAFNQQASLAEVLEAETLEKGQKSAVRRKVNVMKEEIKKLMKFKDDAPDMVDGFIQTIAMVEAKLDGKQIEEKSFDLAA